MRISPMYLSSLLLCIFTHSSMASKNPVTLDKFPSSGFSSPVGLGDSATVTYKLTNKLPYPVKFFSSFSNQGKGFNIANACANKTTNPGESCIINVTFAPLVEGVQETQLTYGYDNNRILAPKLSAQGVGFSPNGNVTGVFSDVPASFNLNNPEQQPTVTVTYTNPGPGVVLGYAGNADGTDLLTTAPTSIATIAVLPGSSCGTASAPVQLKAGDHCQVQGQLTPVGIGSVTIAGLFTYSGSKTATPSAQSSVAQGSGTCVPNISASLKLPSSTNFYEDNVVVFTIANQCQTGTASLGEVSVSGAFSPSSGQTATVTKGTDTCSNTILAAGAPPCQVMASVISSGSSNSTMTVTAAVLTDSTTIHANTSASVTVNQYQHQVTFINQCSFPVWYGVANDNTTNKADPTSPAAPNNYLLTGQVSGHPPQTTTLVFPNDYFGLFFPRTGCTTVGGQLFCQTGQCAPDAPPNGGRCALGNEPEPPYTKIEMNFFASAQSDNSFDGDYDVSMIEGFNVPVEMKAYGPAGAVTAFNPASPSSANNTSFQCTGAGAPIQAVNPPTPTAPLASCPWVVTPPSTNTMEPQFFTFVTDGDSAAGQNNCSCSGANPVCGIAYKANNPQAGNLIMSCGQYLGTWALKTLCTQPFATTVPLTSNNDPRVRFNCDADISTIAGTQSGYTPGTTLSSIYGCVFDLANPTVLNSCYKDSSVSTNLCCGATDWNTTNPYTTAQDRQATTTNPDWGGPTASRASTIVPTPYETIVWYKNACPTAYSYPFDDHSTSFYCKKDNGGNNVQMNYQVVFCPGGLTGS
jgi:hypothetical protein